MTQALYAHMNNKRKKKRLSWMPVAHICNSGYSGDRDQKDRDLKPAQANSSQVPISKKKPHHKKD
jgi:hypothetical protein